MKNIESLTSLYKRDTKGKLEFGLYNTVTT